MPIIQKLENLDNLYQQSSNKIILNRLSITEEDNIRNLLYTTLENETPLVPSCECGKTQGGYLIGKICQYCHTEVMEPFSNFKPILWCESFTPELKFINPEFWAMLSNIISIKMDGLRWLSDTSYRPGNEPVILHSIASMIGGRSYLNVVNNLDKIINILSNNSQYKTLTKYSKLQNLKKVYERQKDAIFSDFLPLINKNLFVMVNTGKGNYSSMLLADIIDQALLVVSTANDPHKTTKQLERVTAKLIHKSAELFKRYVREMVGRKNGIARKNIYGTRANFTFRCVASSIPSKYNYDEIIVPWVVGLAVFRPHIINKLRKRGFYPEEASKLVFDYTNRYHPLIDEILQELIKESPGGYIPVLINRNPSLGQNSIQKLKIVEFNKDPNIQVIYASVLVAPAFNLDFDGDCLNAMLLIDNDMAKRAEVLEPHVNIVAMDVYKISSNLNLPKTSIITLMNYMDKEEPSDPNCPIAKELREMG